VVLESRFHLTPLVQSRDTEVVVYSDFW